MTDKFTTKVTENFSTLNGRALSNEILRTCVTFLVDNRAYIPIRHLLRILFVLRTYIEKFERYAGLVQSGKTGGKGDFEGSQGKPGKVGKIFLWSGKFMFSIPQLLFVHDK